MGNNSKDKTSRKLIKELQLLQKENEKLKRAEEKIREAHHISEQTNRCYLPITEAQKLIERRQKQIEQPSSEDIKVVSSKAKGVKRY